MHADFAARVVLDSAALPWQPSPEPGVLRRPLDRIGAEVARATSVVRYAPGSAFAAHVHGGGEEFLVLDGVFSDEHGDYPAGHYVRNPPGSSHAPRSALGCTLFVKLWQFAPGDAATVVVDAWRSAWQPGGAPGLSVLPLHEHGGTSVALVRCAPGLRLAVASRHAGEELFVIEGDCADEHGRYGAGVWLRDPRPVRRRFESGPRGALLLVRVGAVDAPTLWDAASPMWAKRELA
ncbi:MAG TPA: cupin domain-containing protein [Ideonella sp.]|jgi:anti-sigma factor ChrR (cupin superfamily)|nr:cupin domain-containing protein [Ideonella sp.]